MKNTLGKDYAWLTFKTEWLCKKINGWVEITSTYLDRNNDYIQIYIKKIDDGFILTDDGETIASLIQSGYDRESLTSITSKSITSILKEYGVEEDGEKLKVKTTPDNFSLQKHMLLQAIRSINNMFQPYIAIKK